MQPFITPAHLVTHTQPPVSAPGVVARPDVCVVMPLYVLPCLRLIIDNGCVVT